MKMLNNLKKNNKGFTLIEIIIVIVIIAILAVMLIPAMIEWIDSANERTFLSACDSIETAVLSTCAENYATDGTFSITADTTKKWTDVGTLVGAEIVNVDAEPTSGAAGKYTIYLTVTGKQISKFVIANENFVGTYRTADGGWDIKDATAAS